jgi:very-short-patch-repair endonuclease
MLGTGARVMCASEQQLVCMLHKLDIGSSMCAQVAVDWWRGRVDFLHAQHSMLIQADGSCHDTGMYNSSSEQLLQRDADFCVAAYAKCLPAGGSVLRVRTSESNLCQVLPTGFRLAAGGNVIVLSPSYSDVMRSIGSSGLRTFPQALAAVLQGCSYTVQHGWHVFQRLPPGV